MPTIQELYRTVEQIDAEIAAAEARLGELRLERRGVDAILSRLGLAERPTPSDRQSGARASGTGNTQIVKVVLEGHPEGLDLRAIEAAVAETGTVLDGDQIRSAVTYLRRKSQAERIGRGVWRLTPPTSAESPVAAGPSVLTPHPEEARQIG